MYEFLRRLHTQRMYTIAYVIVDRDSNETQANESSCQQRDRHRHPALNTTLKEVPMLGLERRSAR